MTAKGKVTTASLTPGTRILLRQDGDMLDVAFKKTGAVTATVTGTSQVAPGPYGRQVRYIVHTDLGATVGFAPSQTHYLAGGG